ncbi:MAG: hypothetical protein ACEQSL_04215 [Sediminibacterium sp.]
MLKKVFLFIALNSFVSMLSLAQLSWKLKPYQEVGYCSNILLSPAILVVPSADTLRKAAIYKSDVYNKIGVSSRLEKQDSRGGLLGVNTALQTVNYASFRMADTYMLKNSVDYKFKVDTDFTFIPRVGIEKTKKLTIDIVTDDGVNAYNYWYFSGGSEGFYRVNKKLRLGADIEAGWKSYQTMASGRNFTHTQYLFSIEAEYWMNKINFLNVGLSLKRYDFQKLTSVYIPNTLVDWQYTSIFATLKYKLDNDHYMSFNTELQRKTDFNLADFSFSQWNNRLVWDWYFKRFGIYGDLQANFRNYKRRTAYTESNSNQDYLLLKYNYYTASFKVKYNFSANSMMYLGYSRELRETNSTRLDKMYRRPFSFFGFSIGWNYTFNTEIKRSKPITNL